MEDIQIHEIFIAIIATCGLVFIWWALESAWNEARNTDNESLEKPVYRFRDGYLIYAKLPAGRTEGQVAMWHQEVACMEIKYNGHTHLGFGNYYL